MDANLKPDRTPEKNGSENAMALARRPEYRADGADLEKVAFDEDGRASPKALNFARIARRGPHGLRCLPN